MIGLLSDSHGDLDAFDAAFELLKGKGARRFVFLGGRYTDLDEWTLRRRERARGGRDYTDSDFLADVSSWLGAQAKAARPAAFGQERVAAAAEDPVKLKQLFVRVPERDSLAFRDPAVPKKAVDMVGESLCCVVHDKNDLNREDLLNAAVFLHGREPEPRVVQIGPRFFVSPGQLAGAAEQCCALLESVERQLRFTAFTLEGRAVVDGQLLAVGGKTKLSAK